MAKHNSDPNSGLTLDDLTEIRRFLDDWAWNNQELINSNDRRTRKAMQQIIDANHCLYVASINLGLIVIADKKGGRHGKAN